MTGYRAGRPRLAIAVSGILFSVAMLTAGCISTSPAPAPAPTPPPSPSPTPSSSSSPALARVHDPGRVTGTITGPCHTVGQLPDPRCTPGAVDPAVTQTDIRSTICKLGYTARVRPPVAETDIFKRAAYVAYGIPRGTISELDHRVPLELGGANDALNLWPEVGNVPNLKDHVENVLHSAVCSGKVTLTAAQLAVAADWQTAIQNLGLRS